MAGAAELTAELRTYLAMDRRQAIAAGDPLPDHQRGTALFADIGGFTPLAESMEDALGPQRGAEALANCVHRIFDAFVDAVELHHGSIVAVTGDAMTCWFSHAPSHALAALACGLEMQTAMASAAAVAIPGAGTVALSLKVSVAGGEARRFVVGDPLVQLHDVLAGEPVNRAGAGEKQCRPGEVMLDRLTAEALGEAIAVGERRGDYVCVTALRNEIAADPWPALAPGVIAGNTVRPWMASAVYDRLVSGHGRFLAEFRPVAAVFLSFEDIDYTDPAAGEALDSVIRRTQEITTRHGGSVLDVSMGDKGSYMLIVFGAPVALGDDLRRAVTAADELRRVDGEPRIGAHAGRVFAGTYSGRCRSTYTIYGDVVNTAARLMTNASPGQILMSGRIGASLDRHFSIAALEPIPIKGRVAPIAVCELIGMASADVSLSEPRYALPMVGRERELARIDEALGVVTQGRGALLAFRADAGMGKSRLVNAAIRRAGEEGTEVFAGECQPYGGAIAYLPWQPVWNALLELPAYASDEVRQATLQERLSTTLPDAPPLAPLLGAVLDLPMEDNDATRGMPVAVRKQVLEQLLAGALRARAQRGPVCIVLEDLHWVDSLSRDLLIALLAATADSPVLFLLAYRPPDFEPAIQVPAGSEVELGELSGEEASALARMLLTHVTQAEPEAGAVAAITDRAEGNPFYIEELVREIKERGGSSSNLPTSLESLILGRLDRLEETQQLTARVASVIGRRFDTGWLTGAYANTLNRERVPRDLVGLCASGLIVVDSPAPHEAHLFRHAVVRDVAYEALSFGLRQNLHEQLAAHIELSSDTPLVDLLAYHYAHSANSAKEAVYRRLAAEVAIRNGAYGDALAHVRRASEIVTAQPGGPDRREQELELALMLGSILLVTDGQGSAKAKAVYDRAHELAKTLPPGPAVGRAIFGLWTYYLFQGLMGPTAELADDAVALTDRSPDPGVRIMAHLAVSQTHMWTGQWHKCIEHFDEVMALYDPAQHQAYITQYAQNPRFTASNSAFWAEWMLGNPERATAIGEAAVAEAKSLHHDFTITIAFLAVPLVSWFRRRHTEFLAGVHEYLAWAGRAGNPFYIALASSLDASARILQGDLDRGLDQLERQYAAMHALGSRLVDPLIVSLLAEGYLAARRHGDGLALLERTMPSFERDGQISFLPDHLRLQAELGIARNPNADEDARALLQRAIEVARSHEARSFELRAALAMARLLRERGLQDGGRAALATAYAGFTEGFEDPDLREARALLA